MLLKMGLRKVGCRQGFEGAERQARRLRDVSGLRGSSWLWSPRGSPAPGFGNNIVA